MLTMAFQSGVSTNNLFVVFLAFFLILILSAPISGSHYNPAVTLAFMFRRKIEGRFDRVLGLFYILFQYLGAIGGAVVIFDILEATALLGIRTDTEGAVYWS
jgi:glycerol uptake facilitator-like aquaporin